MTVAELIKALQQLDPTTDVLVGPHHTRAFYVTPGDTDATDEGFGAVDRLEDGYDAVLIS